MEKYFGICLVLLLFLNVNFGCDDGWFEYKNHCYFFQNKTLKGKSWKNASLSCQVMGGSLLSIEDKAENSFILNILKDDSMQKGSYWIGLNDDCNNREFTWSDNKNPQYFNWLSKRPDNGNTGENCVEMNNIGWNDNDCYVKNGFICKLVKEKNDSCAYGWLNYKNYCYFFQKTNETYYGSDWENSYLSCRLRGGNLLSVEDQEENYFVTNVLENESTKDHYFWIGLNYRMSHKKFVWSDNFKWDPKIPFESILKLTSAESYYLSTEITRCVEINADGWNVQNCYKTNGYICKVKRESNNSCASDWFEFASYCYYFQSAYDGNGRKWEHSYLNCLEKGGNLLSIENKTENTFVLNVLKNYRMSKDAYWIGLTDRWYNTWFVWSDNTYSQYAHSKINGLFYNQKLEKCVRMNKTSWELKNCLSKSGFICKTRRAINDNCAKGWTSYRRHCYYIRSLKEFVGYGWSESFSSCQSKGGNLLSIENQEENRFIQNSLIKDNSDYWIGLYRLWNYRRFVWSDNTYTQFFNWIENQPDNVDGIENCVEMNSNGWNDKECNVLNGFICKNKKVFADYVDDSGKLILSQGFLFGTIKVLKKVYTISFNLKPITYSKGLKSVLQLISGNNSEYSEKNLGVWFHEDGSGRFVINATVSGNSNYSIKTDPLILGQWSNIKIYQWLFCNKYWFAIDINGVNIHRVENSLATDFKEIHVYVSKHKDDAQNGSISDFLIINGKAKYLIDHYNTPLVKGKMIAQILKLNKEYLVSFDLYPMVFEIGLHNIIHFMIESHMVNRSEIRSEILGIWLDENRTGRIKIIALINGKKNLFYYPIQLTLWSNIEVCQSFNGFFYVYTIRINGDVVFSMINNQAQDFYDVKVYVSNPWDKVQNGLIKNFFIVNDKKAESLVILAKDYVNLKHEFALNQGTILGTLSVLKKEFTISFNLKPMSYSKGLKNVLHLTLCNNSEINGDRNLGLWFHEDGSGSLFIYAAVNGNSNYAVKTDPLTLGQWHNIRISQWLLGKKYIFTVDLNNFSIHRVENFLAADFKDVKVYGSNIWDAPQNGSISDLLIINGKVEYIIGNTITPLVKGKLIAEIPVLDKEYFVSLDFNAIKFDFGSHNVIHFTIGSDHFNYGDKTPGIWSNAQGNGVLDIASSINGYVDVHTFSTNAFEVNYWSNIVISQVFNGSFYIYTIIINEDVVFSIINHQANSFVNVKVYASNPWSEAQNGLIKNLFVINGNSTKELKPIVILSKVTDLSTSRPSLNKTLVISAAIMVPVLIVLVAVIFIVAVLKFRKKKSKQSIMNLNPYTIEHYMDCHELSPDEWEIFPEEFTLDKKIGEGAFGTVFVAKLSSSVLSKRKKMKLNSNFTENISQVAVKLVKDSADPSELKDFAEEMNLMKEIRYHKNIVNLIGCSTIKKPLSLIVEYMEHGDLLNYLRKRRTNFCASTIDRKLSVNFIYTQGYQLCLKANNKTTTKMGNVYLGVKPNDIPLEESEVITPDDLLSFAWQVASGMEFLSCSKLVHRDLAARNILVGAGKKVKISDFGLTRKINDELNYMSKKKRRLPVKWMSVEAIFDQLFTSFSDVWAYGVVLFEIVTLGGTPYPTISNRELLPLLKSGYRMDKPENCSEKIVGMRIHYNGHLLQNYVNILMM
ncbi:uncharacterized protein LOC100211524 isoform X3 [Hydra vulgaris]|uniref:uncharacterized protein LOC100211524 isoform X3 n=1 Tax=Hydra vulgaris TaxID=6087 RepID=UPI001F5F484A|nr:uncharacterized protein LOC100211524 isoform X4 [Hydra vulgaris]